MKQNLPFLKHILDEINFLMKETEGLEYDEFLKDKLLTRASARSLEIIGEAVKNLSSDFRDEHSDIDWKKIAGIRDRLIHYYFGVNWDIVWAVIKDRLPQLKDKIEAIVNDIEES